MASTIQCWTQHDELEKEKKAIHSMLASQEGNCSWFPYNHTLDSNVPCSHGDTAVHHFECSYIALYWAPLRAQTFLVK